MESKKKNNTNELTYKIKTVSQTEETNLWLPKGIVGAGGEIGVWINIYRLLYTKWISNRDLLNSIGNYIQSLVITYIRKESEKEDAYVYIYICICIYIYTHNFLYT